MLAIQSATAVGPLQMNGATLSMIVTSPSTCASVMPLASPSTIAVRNASTTDIGSSKGEVDNLVMTSHPTLGPADRSQRTAIRVALDHPRNSLCYSSREFIWRFQGRQMPDARQDDELRPRNAALKL